MKPFITWVCLSTGAVIGSFLVETPLEILVTSIFSMGGALLASYIFGDYK